MLPWLWCDDVTLGATGGIHRTTDQHTNSVPTSIGSRDDLDNPDLGNIDWPQQLGDQIQLILDRKRSSVYGREDTYATFCRLAKYHYVEEQIRSRFVDLIAAFCKSIKLETSPAESALALRSLELLAITVFDDTIYENVEPVLTRTIRDSASDDVKVRAIHCLGACALFGGAGEESIMEQMSFLLDIVASDGQSVGADDSGDTVCAALQQWGFLATEIEDLENESEEAIQIFMDQLDSSFATVQIAAGENIALLYEKSYTPQEDDEDEPEEGDEEGSDEEDEAEGRGDKLIKRYNAYHNTPELEGQLQSLASTHDKRISKGDRKSLRENFASILTTVQNPRRGPMYSRAINQATNKHYGSRVTVKIGREGVMSIDRWWKWIRLYSLRRILEGGFAEHYFQGNRAVLDSLPVMVRMAEPGGRGRRDSRKFAKPRTSHRWTGVGGSSDEE